MHPILAALSPNAAVMLLTVGIALIAVELNRPGWILPGTLGVLLALLAAASVLQHRPRAAPALTLIGCMAVLLLTDAAAFALDRRCECDGSAGHRILNAAAFERPSDCELASRDSVRGDSGSRNHCAHPDRATRPSEQGFRLDESAQSAPESSRLMHSLSRALLATATLLVSFTGVAAAQTTAVSRQLSRIDLGISGAGAFNKAVSGPILPAGASNSNVMTTQYGSNTFGAVGTIRYIAKPYVGAEFNYGWARYTENYSPAPDRSSFFQIQTTANEYSLGWVITPPHLIFGLQPFLSAGGGSTEFKPTGGGGEGAPKQARATYYYNVGLQQEFAQSHFGLRVSFRQNFFLAPDFGQNYLTILQHTSTIQPTAGFFLRF